MSEEILTALMELFAIIIKQDGGVTEQEKAYVRGFLADQIGAEGGDEYYRMFLEKAEPEEGQEQKLTSVLDSVRILRIGKKINKTLSQKQKLILLVRALELIATEYTLTEQRVGIVETLAVLFKVPTEEYGSIFNFVAEKQPRDPNDPHLLLITNEDDLRPSARTILAQGTDAPLYVLYIPSVDLYFLRYTGDLDINLNGNTIYRDSIYLLASGSSIRFPLGVPVYYSDITTKFLSAEMESEILVEAENLGYRFPGNVTGLRQVSFSAEQGNLVGIMGASGSGKTTLLNVLSGMYTPSEGTVRINGVDSFRESGRLQGVKGYVPQDDLLVEELTVFQNLWFNAKFCFRELSDEEIRERVMETLDSLGLSDKKDLKVGSVMNKTISGGQRKRLNIALELIREPAVLFLDEPTSGLSSRDSENVMDLLRELTRRGKVIFVVIHQPSSDLYKMFDRVVILDDGGRLVYYGNPVEAVVHFKKMDRQVSFGVAECPECGNVNPEQIFNILEARQVDEYGNYTTQRKISPDMWEQLFRKEFPQEPVQAPAMKQQQEPVQAPAQKPARSSTLEAVQEDTPEASPEASPEAAPKASPDSQQKPPHVQKSLPRGKLSLPPWPGQFTNYLKRDLFSKLGNRQYMILMLGISPILALILSFITRYIADPESHVYIFRENENIPIYIFMAIIVALFLGLIMSAEEIFRDRKILKREKFLHLSRSAYLVAKIINIFMLSALQTLVFVLIANTILGVQHLNFHYWFALFSVAACANVTGLLISSAFNSAVTIYIIIPLVMIPMMVLSGAMFSFEKLNRSITSVNKVPVIAELMPTKWAYEALMVKQFRDNRFQANFFEMDMAISQNNFKTAYFIPELEERLDQVAEYVASASAETGESPGKSALTETGEYSGKETPAERGESAGKPALAETGKAIEKTASTETGKTSGQLTSAETGIAAGKVTSAETGIAAGEVTSAETGIAAGKVTSAETGKSSGETTFVRSGEPGIAGAPAKILPALEVLKNEILREQDSLASYSFSVEDFDPATVNAAFVEQLRSFLAALNEFYLQKYSIASMVKQDYLNTLMTDRKELYYRWLNRYHNESVSDQVKKIYEKNKIIESNGRLYQQIDPIYLQPESVRSHFYAPVKKVFGTFVDTFWFNMTCIWVMTFVLYAVLYYDLLGKLIRLPLFRRKKSNP